MQINLNGVIFLEWGDYNFIFFKLIFDILGCISTSNEILFFTILDLISISDKYHPISTLLEYL